MSMLSTAINALETSASALNSPIAQDLLPCMPSIHNLEEQSQNDVQFGINYGKNPVGHLIILEGKPLLLPTSSWYWGELGPDYIYAAISTESHVDRLPGQRSTLRQYLWWFVIIWRSILRAEWSNTTPTTAEIKMLSEVMARLNLPEIKARF